MRKVLTFLKILISFFILFNCIKSCSRATSILEAFDIFYEATGPSNLMNTGNSTNNGTNGYYNLTSFRNMLAGRNDNCFAIISGGTSTLNYINDACYFYTGGSFSNNYARLDNYTMEGRKGISSNNNVYNVTFKNGSQNVNTSWSGKFLYLFLENGQIVNTNIEIPPSFEFIPTGSQVIYKDYVKLPYANKRSFSVSSWNLGQITDFGDYTKMEIWLRSETTGLAYKSTFINFSDGHWTQMDGDLGLSFDNFLFFPSRLLTYNEVWNLQFYLYLGNTYEHDDTLDYNFLFLPINSVVSGDIILSSGSGDFTNQDVTNTIIDNIYNNNSGEKGIFQKVYDDLFTLGSGDVKHIITSLSSSSPFSSGELQLATIGLSQLLANQSDDFVISWDSFTPHFSIHGEQIDNVQMISGDSLNFSKIVRESPELTEVMVWVHRLVGFSLLYLFAHNVFKTLMHALGIGTAIFDVPSSEQDTVKTTINVDKNGKKSLTTTEKYGNLTIRRNK